MQPDDAPERRFSPPLQRPLSLPAKMLIVATVLAAVMAAVRFGQLVFKSAPKEPATTASRPAPLPAAWQERVKAIVARFTASSPEVVMPAMTFEDLGIDETARIEIGSALEAEFQIRISEAELSGASRISDLFYIVAAKTQQLKD